MNKNKLLLEAIKHQQKKLDHREGILKEALAHPVFESLKQFENELEYRLFEAVVVGAGRAPASGKIAVGGGGSGRFGKYTKVISEFNRLLSGAPKITAGRLPRGFSIDLGDIVDSAEEIIEVLKDENLNKETKQEINIGLIKLENYFTENLKNLENYKENLNKAEIELTQKQTQLLRDKQYVNSIINSVVKNRIELDKSLKSIPGFSGEKAFDDFKKSQEVGAEVDTYEEELKKQSKGFFGRLANKLRGK